MGNLPAERVSYTRPFVFVGIDFADPFDRKPDVRSRSKSDLKVYAAIFVCLVTRCVHIEAVSDLSTLKFLDCFRRFVSRRGVPVKIFSDNATNFVDAKNEIKSNLAEVMEITSNQNVEWEFIPPRSPHKGGIWEAAVKSFKVPLYKVVRNSKLTLEDYSTVFAQIESILNSRPLSYPQKTNDSYELTTPSHFLIGKPLLEETFDKLVPLPPEKLECHKSWRINQQISDSFWHEWRNDYLQSLQVRHQSSQSQGNIAIGDLVFVKEDNRTPLDWNLARVEDPDSDGNVRVVDVKMKNSLKRRSKNRLVRIPDDEPLSVVHPGEYVVNAQNETKIKDMIKFCVP